MCSPRRLRRETVGQEKEGVRQGSPRSPYLTLRLFTPGAEPSQREKRSRGPSHRAGPTAIVSSPLCRALGSSIPSPGLDFRFIGFHQELRFPFRALLPLGQASVGAADAHRGKDAESVYRGLLSPHPVQCLLSAPDILPSLPLTSLPLCLSLPSLSFSLPLSTSRRSLAR